MRRFASLLTVLAPFLVGLVVGALLFYSINTWGVALAEIVRWLVMSAIVTLLIAVAAWLTYRMLTAKLASDASTTLKAAFSEIAERPERLGDPAYRNERLWPLVPTLIRTAIAWFSFSSAMALAITLVANLTLMATLAVQYLQAERLSAQNSLLQIQTLADQIQQGRSIREDLSIIARTDREISRIERAYDAVKTTEAKTQLVSRPIVVRDHAFSPCSAAANPNECERSEFFTMFRAISDHPGGSYPAHQHHDAFALFVAYAQARDAAFRKETREIEQISEENVRDEAQFARDFVTRASMTCRFAPDESRQLTLKLGSVRLVEANAHFVGEFKFDPKFTDFSKRFPQVRANTERGFLNFETGLEGVTTSGESSRYREMTNVEVFRAFAERTREVLLLLQSLDQSCQKEANRLQGALIALEAQPYLESTGTARQ